MTDEMKARAIALYDRFTHDGHDRRAFMAELTTLAGGAAAASALLAGIAADPAAAAIVPVDDKHLNTRVVTWPVGPGRQMSGYMALPAKARGKLPAILVVHENRGLNDHIRDVARRLALEGYIALAPDFLTPGSGTPADEDTARGKIALLDLQQTTADGVATIRWLKADRFTTGRIGTVGFCWGGALVDRLAIASGDALTAAVAYYGPAPDPAEAGRVKAAMLLHFAGLDDRVNAGGRPWAAALIAAHVDATAFEYPGVNHAFNNDTSPERYDKAAATLAWDRTSAFFARHLKAPA